jgi:hypothetical protein
MKRMTHTAAAAIVAASVSAHMACAQDDAPDEAPPRGVMVIYDSSNSMWGELSDGRRKYEAAREALGDFLEEDFPDRDLAFRAYGHRRAGDCRDSELIAGFGRAADVSQTVAATAGSIIPRGRTPIDWSLRQALADFAGRSGDIILITDGIESCDADPGALAQAWADQDVGVQIHVVGLGLDAVARSAMQCIADASGTTYRDAASTDGLAESLNAVRRAALAEPDPQPAARAAGHALIINARNADGEPVLAHAEIAGPSGATHSMRTDGRYSTVQGAHVLHVGIQTANTDLYRPVRVTADVAGPGETLVEAEVATPPRVMTAFVMEGEPAGGALVRAYQDGREIFTIRPGDAEYVNEGVYEFRTVFQGMERSVEEVFAAGDVKTVTFEFDRRVRQLVTVLAGDTGEVFRHNFELWRDGEMAHSGHVNNGAIAAPGRYEFRLDSELTPFTVEGFSIPDTDDRREIVAPAGVLVVRYETPDGQVAPDNGYFIGRLDEIGREHGRRVYRSDNRTAFLPGRYRVTSRLSGRDDAREIEIADGGRIEIVFPYLR